MTKEDLTAWATANGWRPVAGHLSLTKPRAPSEPIVRLLLKVTVATLEIRKPAGKWEKIASTAYAQVTPDEQDGPPHGLGFELVPSLSMLMQDNRDQMVFARGWALDLPMTETAIRDALTSAMQYSTKPMVLSDPRLPDTPMIAANQAFLDMTGYPLAEIVGRNCRFLQGPRTDPVSPPRIRACLDAGQGCIEWIVNYRRDGSRFYNLLFISPVHDADGTLLYFFGNQLDITMGSPDWLSEVSFGSAHVVPALETEFHALLKEVGVAAHTEGLDRIVRAAHRLAEITTKLKPGTLAALEDARS